VNPLTLRSVVQVWTAARLRQGLAPRLAHAHTFDWFVSRGAACPICLACQAQFRWKRTCARWTGKGVLHSFSLFPSPAAVSVVQGDDVKVVTNSCAGARARTHTTPPTLTCCCRAPLPLLGLAGPQVGPDIAAAIVVRSGSSASPCRPSAHGGRKVPVTAWLNSDC